MRGALESVTIHQKHIMHLEWKRTLDQRICLQPSLDRTQLDQYLQLNGRTDIIVIGCASKEAYDIGP